MMPDWIQTDSWLITVLWQSTAWLLAGLLAAAALKSHPARAHAVLMICLIAALLTPVLTWFFGTLGWGFLRPVVMTGPSDSMPPDLPGRGAAGVDPWRMIILTITGIWTGLTMIFLMRLVGSFRAGLLLLAKAESCRSESVHRALREAKRLLDMTRAPELLVSDAVRSPVIWCWSRTPRIVLPRTMRDRPGHDLIAVLGHELAHLKRRDHLASLIFELARCLLPWHPLMWTARRRGEELREQSCDAWVLHAGSSPATYAELLLSLIPQPGPIPMMAALRHRRGLPSRIERILNDDSNLPPDSGVRFTYLALVGSLGIIATTALAHRRPPLIVNPADPDRSFIVIEPEASRTPEDVVSLNTTIGTIEVRPAELDLGFAPAGTVASGSVWLINHGHRPVTIAGSKASCGCTTVEDVAGAVLGPGESRQVMINIESDGAPGRRKTKHVTFQFEGLDPVKIPVHVTVPATAP